MAARIRVGICAWVDPALIEVHYKSRPYTDVALSLGVPIGTVRSRLHYALRTLRAAVEALVAVDVNTGDFPSEVCLPDGERIDLLSGKRSSGGIATGPAIGSSCIVASRFTKMNPSHVSVCTGAKP